MCRCRERGQAIVHAIKATARGDGKAVAQDAKFVATTAAEDAAAAFRKSITAAKSRLSRR